MTNLPSASEVRKTAKLAEQRLHEEAVQTQQRMLEEKKKRAEDGRLFAQSKLSQISDAIRSRALNGNYCYEWTEVGPDDTSLSQIFLESFAEEVKRCFEPMGYTVSYTLKTLKIQQAVWNFYYALEVFILW